MGRKILVLFDSLDTRKEVLSYAVELAKRIRTGLHILVLLPWESANPQTLSDPAAVAQAPSSGEEEHAAKDWLEKNLSSRVNVTGTIRRGDQASELLKILAENPPFQAVIWGGNEKFLRQKRIPVRGHWLERVRQELGCPLVVPSLRGKENHKGKARRHMTSLTD